MKPFIAHCTVNSGKIQWRNEDYLNINLPKYEGLQGVLTIKKKWNKRSLNQNAYMWLCFETLSEHTGHTPEEIHVLCKGLYAPKKHLKVKDKV